MALLQIRVEGDDMLKRKAKPVKEVTPDIISLLDDMLETLNSKDGVGIAAPQIGKLKRIAIVSHDDELFEMINPEIVETEGTQTSNEACLSVPGRCGDVERPFQITVKATDRNGEEYTVTVDDFLASVFCHELDHLDGVVFLDKAANIQMINQEQMEEHRRNRRARRREKRAIVRRKHS